jgi:hypothetical protein
MIRFIQPTLILAIAVIAFSPPHLYGDEPGKFTGVPRDIDYLRDVGWTQVIIQHGENQLISQTKNERIQSILTVALVKKLEVTVQTVLAKDQPKALVSVAMKVNARDEDGHVFAISFDEKTKRCSATVYYMTKKVDVWTDSPRMQNILETAVRQSIAVGYFSFDEKTKEITRGKLNSDDSSAK